MKVLVTGADGYLGRGVVEKLLEGGHEVLGFGLGEAPRVYDAPSFSYEQCDVMKLNSEELSDLNPDVVVHLAWRNGFRHREVSHIDDLPGHYAFIRSCVKAGVPKVAVMGSMHEVGYHEGAVSADTPCRPTTPYAIAKNALRQLATAECSESETDLLWMRGYYIVSADGLGDSIFSKIIKAEKEGKRTFPFTTGKNKYDFLDYSEFCSKVARLAADHSAIGIENVCSGKPESLASRVERFIEENNLSIRLEYGAFPDRPYDSPAIWGETNESSGAKPTSEELR